MLEPFTLSTLRRLPSFILQGVSQGTLTVGDAVLFLSLLQQLYAPLNYFGSYYRCHYRLLNTYEAHNSLTSSILLNSLLDGKFDYTFTSHPGFD